METGWPGEPRGAWDRADVYRYDLWTPVPTDLPPWRTPEEFDAHYAAIPPWWQRALLLVLGLLLGALVLCLLGWGDLPAGTVGEVGELVVMAATALAMAGGLGRWAVREAGLRHRRAALVREDFDRLRAAHVPVWALFVGKVRLGDRISGVNDTPDDLVFVFDLRVPPGILRRQRAAVVGWVDSVADRYPTNVPRALAEAFAGRPAVHCADVFGEEMRGVWMWRKGSVLPFQVFGLSPVDPRAAEEFTDEQVLFMRRPPARLRQLSRIAKV